MDRYGGIALGVECAWPGPKLTANTVKRRTLASLAARLLASLARLG